MRATALGAATLLALACAGCGAGSLGGASPAAPAAPEAQTATVDMAGRWMLSTPGTPPCGITLSGNRSEGTIAPEGGCPGNFFTSRRWTFEQGALMIRDHNSEVLGQLKLNGDRYEGKSVDGQTIILTR